MNFCHQKKKHTIIVASQFLFNVVVQFNTVFYLLSLFKTKKAQKITF